MMEVIKHVQVEFYTKQQKFAIPKIPYSIPSNVTITDLNALIKSLLQDVSKDTDFDFIVEQEFLRGTLNQLLEYKEISTENVIEIEYVEKLAPPSPKQSLLHDDWVSAVRAYESWILTGCYDNTLHIWTLDGEHVLTIPGHVQPIKAVAWLANQDSEMLRFVSVSFDQTAMIWEWQPKTNSVHCIYICRGHANTILCVDTDQIGNKFATGSWDQMIKIWSSSAQDSDNTDRKRMKIESGSHSKTRTPIMTLSGHREVVSALQWIDTNELCSASWDHTMRIWDVEMGGIKCEIVGSKNFLDISYSSLNRLIVSGSTDRHVRLWDPRHKNAALVQSVFTSHNGWVTCVEWAKDDVNKFVSGSYDSLIKMWDMRSCKAPLYDMAGHEDQILCCDWSIKDNVISGGSDNKLKIFKC